MAPEATMYSPTETIAFLKPTSQELPTAQFKIFRSLPINLLSLVNVAAFLIYLQELLNKC